MARQWLFKPRWASVSLAVAYLSYELFEKRFLNLKRLFQPAKEPAPQSSPAPFIFLEQRPVVQGAKRATTTAQFFSKKPNDSSDE